MPVQTVSGVLRLRPICPSCSDVIDQTVLFNSNDITIVCPTCGTEVHFYFKVTMSAAVEEPDDDDFDDSDEFSDTDVLTYGNDNFATEIRHADYAPNIEWEVGRNAAMKYNRSIR